MRTLLESKGRAEQPKQGTSSKNDSTWREIDDRYINSIKAKSYGSSKYWLLIMDDCSDEAWSRFLKKKSKTTEQVVALIKDLKEKGGKTVKYIRCDNAGENKSLENECLRQGLGITFEYTAPGTPQHNGRIERRFPTIYGRVRSTMNKARIPKKRSKGEHDH
jgi:transposase InsO family protein